MERRQLSQEFSRYTSVQPDVIMTPNHAKSIVESLTDEQIIQFLCEYRDEIHDMWTDIDWGQVNEIPIHLGTYQHSNDRQIDMYRFIFLHRSTPPVSRRLVLWFLL